MSIFSDYANYYDLLYQDKDYEGEAKFILKLLQTYAPEARNLLELGCGTGTHAMLLAKSGYRTHGIDISLEMLQVANNRLSRLPKEIVSNLQFTQGDIREVRLEQNFDVVLSLFHVISYQSLNEDLLAAFATVKEHLKPGGIFIFDVWYGPAVLSDRPTVRIKRLQNQEISVTRIAEPVIYPNENLVDVNYQVLIVDQRNNSLKELHETHRMRYLFQSEIKFITQQYGMKVIDTGEWMGDKKTGFDTWSVYFVIENNCEDIG